ncbi:hypothetical protein AAMO2058_000844500 [Amorphochlora amoebiformis]
MPVHLSVCGWIGVVVLALAGERVHSSVHVLDKVVRHEGGQKSGYKKHKQHRNPHHEQNEYREEEENGSPRRNHNQNSTTRCDIHHSSHRNDCSNGKSEFGNQTMDNVRDTPKTLLLLAIHELSPTVKKSIQSLARLTSRGKKILARITPSDQIDQVDPTPQTHQNQQQTTPCNSNTHPLPHRNHTAHRRCRVNKRLIDLDINREDVMDKRVDDTRDEKQHQFTKDLAKDSARNTNSNTTAAHDQNSLISEETECGQMEYVPLIMYDVDQLGTKKLEKQIAKLHLHTMIDINAVSKHTELQHFPPQAYSTYSGIYGAPAKPAALRYFANHPDTNLRFAWFVEGDVLLEPEGSWKEFLDYYADSDVDLISMDLRRDDTDYPNSWRNYKNCDVATPSNHARAFVPIHRLSKRFANKVLSYLMGGKRGHHECVLPSLCQALGQNRHPFGCNMERITRQFKGIGRN